MRTVLARRFYWTAGMWFLLAFAAGATREVASLVGGLLLIGCARALEPWTLT